MEMGCVVHVMSARARGSQVAVERESFTDRKAVADVRGKYFLIMVKHESVHEY